MRSETDAMSYTTESTRAQACPFCGVATDSPHDTQEGCIEALQAEIARVRGILDAPMLTHLSDRRPPPPDRES